MINAIIVYIYTFFYENPECGLFTSPFPTQRFILLPLFPLPLFPLPSIANHKESGEFPPAASPDYSCPAKGHALPSSPLTTQQHTTRLTRKPFTLVSWPLPGISFDDGNRITLWADFPSFVPWILAVRKEIQILKTCSAVKVPHIYKGIKTHGKQLKKRLRFYSLVKPTFKCIVDY